MIDLTLAARLDATIKAVFPNILGVRIGKLENRATWGVFWPDGFVPNETELQTVSQLIESFDASPPIPSVEAKSLEERLISLEEEIRQLKEVGKQLT